MRIGIDIDDVMTNTSEAMREYIEKYDKNGEISDHMEEVMRGEIPNEQVAKFFADNIVAILKSAKLKENVSQVIRRLREEENEIYIITARGEDRFQGSQEITLDYLAKNQIGYTKIIFNAFRKAELCEENKIDVLVDDALKPCLAVKEKGIRSILFVSDVNQNCTAEIEKVTNWIELEEKLKVGEKNGI